MKKQSLKCLQKNLDHTAQGHQFHQKWKMIWKGEVLLLWKEKHFCIGNTKTFNRPSGSKTLVSSVLCIIKLRLVLFMFYLWCRATVHNQNRSVGQGHFHTLGQWLWSNQKEMLLPNMTNYLFWHNRQNHCFSLSSIFISSSLLSDQCWWQYIKCLEFQWNCHYKGFQGFANFLWTQSETRVCSSPSHIPCSPDFPVWSEQVLCSPSHPGV